MQQRAKKQASDGKGKKSSRKGDKKTFVLDTNVLLHDPRAMFSFEDNDVVIPIYVVEEIDAFKKDLSELGRNARQVSRYLDQLRDDGSLSEGVKLDRGGTLRVAITHRTLPANVSTDRGQDSKILAVALELTEERKKKPGPRVVFITKDTNLRIRADAIGIPTEDFEPEHIVIDELYKGWQEVDVDGPLVDKFYAEGGVELPDPYHPPNEYVCLRDQSSGSRTALGRVRLDDTRARVSPIDAFKQGIWGIRPKNREQHFALDALLDDKIKLVTLVGKAGSGKTLLAIAAGLAKTTEESVYQRLLVSRPIFPLGKDIGYLPGDVEEKLNPWMQPIFDNVEFLMGLTQKDKRRGRSYKELLDMGMMQIEPLTYIRGRSIPSQYMIVDEAQNLTPHEVKTIISRAGEGTKIVLTGDPYQIDNPYVDQTNNGLVHTVNRFKTEKIAAHVTLVKGERSELAEIAANVL
ncbi:MAG: PhoH family protein [Deltaproteobacteria bacterium]|nr:PhoH family protein [Deltaproteobacteria bacterium]